MSQASYRFSPDVVRLHMPDVNLCPDLIGRLFTSIPPAPEVASEASRLARIDRIVMETAAYLPADAAQGDWRSDAEGVSPG